MRGRSRWFDNTSRCGLPSPCASCRTTRSRRTLVTAARCGRRSARRSSSTRATPTRHSQARRSNQSLFTGRSTRAPRSSSSTAGRSPRRGPRRSPCPPRARATSRRTRTGSATSVACTPRRRSSLRPSSRRSSSPRAASPRQFLRRRRARDHRRPGSMLGTRWADCGGVTCRLPAPPTAPSSGTALTADSPAPTLSAVRARLRFARALSA